MRDDFRYVVDLMIRTEGFRVFEAYSGIDKPHREVTSSEEFEATFEAEHPLVRGWSPQFTNRPLFRQVKLNPTVGKKRTALEGPGIVQIDGGRLLDGPKALYPTRMSLWNERGARSGSGYSEDELNEVDWAALRRVSARLVRAIEKASPAKLHRMPIMPCAFAALERGEFQLWNFGEAVGNSSSKITKN
jgi:hypothetical protein